MADTTPHTLSEIPPWRRLVLATAHIGFFGLLLLLVYWLSQPLAEAGVPKWITALIFLILVVVGDVLLDRVLLRPVRRSHAEQAKKRSYEDI